MSRRILFITWECDKKVMSNDIEIKCRKCRFFLRFFFVNKCLKVIQQFSLFFDKPKSEALIL